MHCNLVVMSRAGVVAERNTSTAITNQIRSISLAPGAQVVEHLPEEPRHEVGFTSLITPGLIFMPLTQAFPWNANSYFRLLLCPVVSMGNGLKFG